MRVWSHGLYDDGGELLFSGISGRVTGLVINPSVRLRRRDALYRLVWQGAGELWWVASGLFDPGTGEGWPGSGRLRPPLMRRWLDDRNSAMLCVRLPNNDVGTLQYTAHTPRNAVGTPTNVVSTLHNAIGTPQNAVGTSQDAIGTSHNAMHTPLLARLRILPVHSRILSVGQHR